MYAKCSGTVRSAATDCNMAENGKQHIGMNFSRFLRYLGDFRRHQKRMIILTALPRLVTAMHAISLAFLTVTPEYRCYSESLDTNISFWSRGNESLFVNSSVTYANEEGELSRCSKPSHGNMTSETEPCTQWVYDTSSYPASRGMDWNWVCDRQYMSNIAQSCYMAGMLVGSLVLGAISDRYGRRMTFLGSVWMTVFWGLMLVIAPEYVTFVICRFMLGFCHAGVVLTGYVIGLELVGPLGQVIGGAWYSINFCSAFLLLAFLSYFIRHWVALQLTITLPGLLFISYWWFIPESARWLVQKGRMEEAKQILLNAAKENDREIPEELFAELDAYRKYQKLEQEKKTEPNMFDLLRTPNMRRTALIVFYNWFMTSMVYWGLSLNTSKLPGGNMYINLAVSGAVEVPSILLGGWCNNRFGRRPAMITCMLVSGLGCIIAACIPDRPGLGILSVIFAMFGKCGGSAGFVLVYQYSAEAFPTVVRNSAMGISSMVARVGGILAPIIYLVGDFTHPVVPFVIMGVLAMIAGFLGFLLPETRNMPLPETLEDGEKFGTKEYKAWIGMADKATDDSELKELPV